MKTKLFIVFSLFAFQGSFAKMLSVVDPVAPSLSHLTYCDSNNDGFGSFDLTDQNAAIFAAQSGNASDYSIGYYETFSSANTNTNPITSAYYNINPFNQIIYYRITNINTSTYAIGNFQLIVNSMPFATGPQSFADCDNYANPFDGIGILDLTQYEYLILNGQNPGTHQITYFTTQADAINGSNPISLSSAQAFITPTTVVWVKVTNSSGCYALTSIYISIESTPNPIITSTNNRSAICVNYITNAVQLSLTLYSGIVNPSAYAFEWYETSNPSTVIGTGSTYTVDAPSANGANRNYKVLVTSNSILGCNSYSLPFSVIQSGQAAFPFGSNGYTITNLSGIQSINIDISGYGTYEYSLDNGPGQTNSIFENVSVGTHTVTVWDTEGGIDYSCDPLIINNIAIVASQVPAPTGLNSQTFNTGATLADIVVTGTNIQWYASAANKNSVSMLATPLQLSTVLVNGTTYYATQTVGGIESTAYLPVTVSLTLGTGDNDALPIRFAPNPVKNSVTLQSAVVVKSVLIYTMLGQKVFEQNCNDTNVLIDLSKLTTGNYILKAQGETGQKTVRIVKE